MTDFKKFFGYSKRLFKSQATYLELDTSFRFNNSIAEVSKKFIRKNKNQLNKTLKSKYSSSKKSVYLHWTNNKLEESLLFWLKKYGCEKKYRNKDLLILGRYEYTSTKISIKNQKLVAKIWKHNGNVKFNTCHGSKGTESDVVIILGISSDSLGFPSNIVDDPVLALVLAKHDNFAFAEERRLLYVSITRAKFEAHLICDYLSQSVFAKELSNTNYNINIENSIAENSNNCPKCNKGIVLKIKSKKNSKNYYKCNHNPLCDYWGHSCNCGELILPKPDDNEVVCSNKKCKKKYEVCRKCKIGVMIEKINSETSEKFRSCTNCKKTDNNIKI